jgi:hypothetical protein
MTAAKTSAAAQIKTPAVNAALILSSKVNVKRRLVFDFLFRAAGLLRDAFTEAKIRVPLFLVKGHSGNSAPPKLACSSSTAPEILPILKHDQHTGPQRVARGPEPHEV